MMSRPGTAFLARACNLEWYVSLTGVQLRRAGDEVRKRAASQLRDLVAVCYRGKIDYAPPTTHQLSLLSFGFLLSYFLSVSLLSSVPENAWSAPFPWNDA